MLLVSISRASYCLSFVFFFFSIIIIIILHFCLMSACICTTYLPDIWWKSEEGVTLELELWMVVNHLVGAGN